MVAKNGPTLSRHDVFTEARRSQNVRKGIVIRAVEERSLIKKKKKTWNFGSTNSGKWRRDNKKKQVKTQFVFRSVPSEQKEREKNPVFFFFFFYPVTRRFQARKKSRRKEIDLERGGGNREKYEVFFFYFLLLLLHACLLHLFTCGLIFHTLFFCSHFFLLLFINIITRTPH